MPPKYSDAVAQKQTPSKHGSMKLDIDGRAYRVQTAEDSDEDEDEEDEIPDDLVSMVTK